MMVLGCSGTERFGCDGDQKDGRSGDSGKKLD